MSYRAADSSPPDRVVELAARNDRVVIAIALATVAALAWLYVLGGAGMQMDMADMAMPMQWTPRYALIVFMMWWVMMIAMMLPSAAPMILIFSTVQARTRSKGGRHIPTSVFALGYLLSWAGFSVIATILHWLLDRTGMLSAQMAAQGPWLASALLIAAGLYQLSPLKHACLRRCRGPIQFITEFWRPGPGGALRMGLLHGGFCVGCCWVVMGLLFFGGVMNVWWIVGLAALVLAEKILPRGYAFGWLSGVGFLAWGILLLLNGFGGSS